MEFVEAPAFSRHLAEYLSDGDYTELQIRLERNPDAGEVMPGTGGFRKLRWRDRRRGEGRRGGLRIIYYYFATDQQIWLMTIYGKNEAADLTAEEKKTLKAAIELELKARSASRATVVRKRRR